MPSINNFLKGFSDGLPGMKDYRHASRLYVDDNFKLAPKAKFHFHVVFDLDEEVNFWSVLGTVINKNLDYFKKFDNVKIVDPIQKLTSTDLNFTDGIHLTPVGNYVLASETAKSILLKN